MLDYQVQQSSKINLRVLYTVAVADAHKQETALPTRSFGLYSVLTRSYLQNAPSPTQHTLDFSVCNQIHTPLLGKLLLLFGQRGISLTVAR